MDSAPSSDVTAAGDTVNFTTHMPPHLRFAGQGGNQGVGRQYTHHHHKPLTAAAIAATLPWKVDRYVRARIINPLTPVYLPPTNSTTDHHLPQPLVLIPTTLPQPLTYIYTYPPQTDTLTHMQVREDGELVHPLRLRPPHARADALPLRDLGPRACVFNFSPFFFFLFLGVCVLVEIDGVMCAIIPSVHHHESMPTLNIPI